MGWIIFIAIAVPLLALVAWVVFDDSLVRIEPGQLGLLLVHGRATDRALDPGPHWVPALRRRMVQTTRRWSCPTAPVTRARARPPELERTGPAPRVDARRSHRPRWCLHGAVPARPTSCGRSTSGSGRTGIWAAVRDETSGRSGPRADAGRARGSTTSSATARAGLEQRARRAVAAPLAALGFVVTMFSLGDIDLGRRAR